MNSLIIRETEVEELLKEFYRRVERFPPEDQADFRRAVETATELHKDQQRASGEPYIIHPLQVAAILANLKMDKASIIAGLLHDVIEDTALTRDQLKDSFGAEVESLVDGVTKIHILHAKTKSVQEAETIRKMFFAMTKDIRVILIKLADKVHNMSTLQHLREEKARRIAQECLDIYAPLAGRLGLFGVKSQLEDLALKTLDKDSYYLLKDFVTAKRGEREEYLKRVKDDIYREAAKDSLKITVDARAKHFYSIYSKWKKKGGELSEVFDILGVRVYCSTNNECYQMLGLIHRLWKPIEGRFKDYIAMPKDNGYQSLHTTVMCYGGRLTEIQIRTYDMHKTAEYGVAAHWVYKEGKVRPEDLAIVNRLKSWQTEGLDGSNFLEEIKGELLRDSIYVFTPKGKVVELPAGATALDFAYTIHTEVGNHTMAAKADGSIIPLSQELKNTQVIEIITHPNSKPNVNWLRNARTSRARSKIRHWLTHNDESVILEKNIVAKKQPLTGLGPKGDPKPASLDQAPAHDGSQRVMDQSKVGVRMGMERNLLIHFANCCKPANGDPIVGFVSRGRGLIIHRQDCRNLGGIRGFDERQVEVEWETVSPRVTRRFRVVAKKVPGLFSEIEGAVRKHKGHLIEGKLEDDGQGHLFGNFTMELEKEDDLSKVIKGLRGNPNINSIQKLD